MRYEFTRIEPVRAANILALVYGILLAVFAVIFAPLLLLATMFAPAETNVAEFGVIVAVLCAYPFIGLVMGWISGLVTAAGFNLVVRVTGGLVVHTPETAGSPAAAP
jgi:hypothetical protein